MGFRGALDVIEHPNLCSDLGYPLAKGSRKPCPPSASAQWYHGHPWTTSHLRAEASGTSIAHPSSWGARRLWPGGISAGPPGRCVTKMRLSPHWSICLSLILNINSNQRAAVKEYWVVDPTSRTVSVYTLEEGAYNGAAIYTTKDSAPVGIFEDCAIDSGTVFPER